MLQHKNVIISLLYNINILYKKKEAINDDDDDDVWLKLLYF